MEGKKWTDKKTTKQIDDELWKIIRTYDMKTLQELFFNSMTTQSKKDWINDWHENDE